MSQFVDALTPVQSLQHEVLGVRLGQKWPAGVHWMVLGMGCFWGAERLFWQLPGVRCTAVGYAGGHVPNPDYRRVCQGDSGHAEVVLVHYEPQVLPISALLRAFWENHDPTQGNRQGNDVGPQYRSILLLAGDGDLEPVGQSYAQCAKALTALGYGAITTEVGLLDTFYYAEAYHQQYLARQPHGYCGLRRNGVSLA